MESSAGIPSSTEPASGCGPARDAGPWQYSLAQILAVWAAAAIPMGLLAWVAAPWLADRLRDDEPLAGALLISLAAGLVWQFALVMILVRRELGGPSQRRLREALWLRPPREPRSGRIGGRVWWWVAVFLVLYGLAEALPALTGPLPRTLGEFVRSERGHEFFSAAWGWWAVVVVLAVFNTVLGEELLFRGLLLPRMQGVFGRRDWIANGALFAVYHLHIPWSMPSAFISGSLLFAYPSRRFASALMGIVVHSAQSVVLVSYTLALVLS